MGRKIPAKKHRGVKDPLLQQARRQESLKGKINAPPRDPDEQPVPKSLLRLFGADKPARVRAGRGTAKAGRGTAGADHPVARLRQLPGEARAAFSRRITGATRALHDALDSQCYPQEEEDEPPEPRARRRRPAARPAGPAPEPRARRRRLRMQEKRKQAEQEAQSAARDAPRYEHVPFGERVDAPPSLPAPRLPRAPAAASTTGAARPGRRELLLTPLLAGRGAVAEERRLQAVAAYRALKAARLLRPAAGDAPRRRGGGGRVY